MHSTDYRRGRDARAGGRARGVVVAAVLIGLAALTGRRAVAAGRDDGGGETYRAQLRAACEALERQAVKGAYGWGWTGEAAPADDAGPAEEAEEDARPTGGGRARGKSRKPARPAKTPVRRGQAAAAAEIDLRATAAAGLVLHLAGRELDEPRFAKAAAQAARAIAAVQLPTGQVPPTARLVPKPGANPESSEIVPDRAPTCAAVALLSLLLESKEAKPNPRLMSAATRGAGWVSKQQTGAGGWQSAYPPGTGPKARRLVRLDGPGYRDANFLLILASRVLGRKEYGLAVDRSVRHLLDLCIAEEESPGVGLWAPAYTLGGEPAEDVEELPYVIDVLASRYALETLLAARLVAGKDVGAALAAAAKSAGGLPREDGQWQRWYDLFLREPPKPEPQPGGSEVFDHDPEDEAASVVTGDFGLAGILEAVNAAQAMGADKFGRLLTADFSRSERLAVAVCGLADDGLTLRLPTDPAERDAFLAASLDETTTSPDLPKPVARAWGLLLKAKVEQRAQAAEE